MSFSISRGLAVVIFAAKVAAIITAAFEEEGNPLATLDQHDLDALSIKINEDQIFSVLKLEAKAAFNTVHGLPISQEAASQLQSTINELSFSSIQSAVNSDPYHPKVY